MEREDLDALVIPYYQLVVVEEYLSVGLL